MISNPPSWGKPKKEWRNSDTLSLAANPAASVFILLGLLSLCKDVFLVWMSVRCAEGHRGQKRVSDPLELEFIDVGSHPPPDVGAGN